MRKLVKCEMEKLRIRNYVFSAMSLILLLCFFMMVAMDSAKQGLSEPILTYSSIIKSIITFMINGSIIYGSVLIANLVVSEYTNKTILIMFSYPIKKESIIYAKLILSSAIINLIMIIGCSVCILIVTIIDYKLDMLVGVFNRYDFLDAVSYIAIGVIMANIYLLLPYSIGIWKKSISLTVVSSLVAVFIVQVIMSQSTSFYQIIFSDSVTGVVLLTYTKCISSKYIRNIECL